MGWPTNVSDTETGEWTRADLRAGDLVFGQRRDGPLARLCALAREPWRHVGSLVEHDGVLRIVEVLGDAFRLNDLDRFFDPDRYERWGAARLGLDDDCVVAANAWMRARLGDYERVPQVYAWDDLVLAGFISAAHRGLFALDPTQVRAALATAAGIAKPALEYRGAPSLTCSAFIQIAYEEAGGSCALEHRRWRGEPVSWPDRSPQIDELFEMTEEELADYDDLSIVDLYLESERVDRGTSTTRARPGHVAEMVKVLAAAAAGYAFGSPPPDRLDVDSRWVTPGDLWDSPSVYERAYVVPVA